MLESEIEEYLVARVKALGGEVRKVKWIGRRGAPDRLVMLPSHVIYVEGKKGVQAYAPRDPGNPIWVELKKPGEKPRPQQLREHDRMRSMGQRVEVIDSKDGVDALLG